MVELRRQPDLLQEALGADVLGDLGAEDLDRDVPAVLEVFGQHHDRHAAPAQLAFDPVATGERVLQMIEEVGHGDKMRRPRRGRENGSAPPASRPLASTEATAQRQGWSEVLALERHPPSPFERCDVNRRVRIDP